jgi:hypothetical protein
MPEPLITVTIERKHNLGNYEHVLGSVSIQFVGGGATDESIRSVQDAILPFLTVEALTRGVQQHTRAQVKTETNAAPAEPAEKPRAARGRGRAAEAARPAEPDAAIEAALNPADAEALAELAKATEAPPSPAVIRARITEICSGNAKAAEAVRRHLAANGLAKLRQVDDEALGEYLALAEGRPATVTAADDDGVI